MRILTPSIRSTTRRAGFTLLEVLLASAVALVVMFGLYVTMDSQLRVAQADRETVERATVIRGIFNRLTIDLSSTCTPIAVDKGTTTASSSTQNTTGTTGGTQTTTDTSMTGVSSATTPVTFQAGVVGDSTYVTIYTTRVPEYTTSMAGDEMTATADQQVPGDIRRITYWLANGGGLARREFVWSSSDEAVDSPEPIFEDENQYIIAEEVTNVQFEYFDPTSQSWSDSWSGSDPGSDGITQKGPPSAIRITLRLSPRTGSTREQEYKHVIAIQTADGSADNETIPTATGG